MLDGLTVKYNLTKDFLHFIALCGIFPPSYNICKHWNKHEDVFIDLVKREGKIGIQHFMQALMVYFIRVQSKDFIKYGATCLHTLWKA